MVSDVRDTSRLPYELGYHAGQEDARRRVSQMSDEQLQAYPIEWVTGYKKGYRQYHLWEEELGYERIPKNNLVNMSDV